MREPMTTHYYNLLVSAGLLKPRSKYPPVQVPVCLATDITGKTGVAIAKDGKLCTVYAISETTYDYVYTHYERTL